MNLGENSAAIIKRSFLNRSKYADENRKRIKMKANENIYSRKHDNHRVKSFNEIISQFANKSYSKNHSNLGSERKRGVSFY